MRKTVSLGVIISLISCLLFSVTASATTVNDYNRTIEYLDNGDYIETIISDDETDSEISLFSTAEAIERQVGKMLENDVEYIRAVAVGDLAEVRGLENMDRLIAREPVYAAMVYV